MQINKTAIAFNRNLKINKEVDINIKSTDNSLLTKNSSYDKITLTNNQPLNNSVENYNCNKKNMSFNQVNKLRSSSFAIDKGTASHTTVFINRSAYDKILSETTFGEKKWEEMGVDDEKRWVVINGQRFECEHSPEEKALRKRLQKTVVDYFIEADEKKAEKKDNGKDKPKGNVEALTNNKEVMNLLMRIFKIGTVDGVLKKIS